MYASVSNILFTCVWIVGIIGIFAILKRKKQNLESFDKAEGIDTIDKSEGDSLRVGYLSRIILTRF